VAAALCARDLGALHAHGHIHVPVHRARDLRIERRPAAPGVKLGLRPARRALSSGTITGAGSSVEGAAGSHV